MEHGGAPDAHVVQLDAVRRGRRSSAPPPAAGTGPKRGLLYVVAAVVVTLGAVVSLGSSVAAVWASRGGDEGGLRTLGRALPLAVGAAIHLVVFAPASLLTMTVVLGFVHLFDFWIGIATRDLFQVGLPLLFAVLTFASALPQLAEAAFGGRES